MFRPRAGSPVLTFLVLIGAAVITVVTPNLLYSVISLGAVGFLLAIVYLFLAAPDIAIVQIGVEVVSLVILIRATLGRESVKASIERPSMAVAFAVGMVAVIGLFGLTDASVAEAVQIAIAGDNRIQITLDDEDVDLLRVILTEQRQNFLPLRVIKDRLETGEIDPDRSTLVNRAIQGRYNLGSTFKPFTAFAALDTGLLGVNDYYLDQGTYRMESVEEDRCGQPGPARADRATETAGGSRRRPGWGPGAGVGSGERCGYRCRDIHAEEDVGQALHGLAGGLVAYPLQFRCVFLLQLIQCGRGLCLLLLACLRDRHVDVKIPHTGHLLQGTPVIEAVEAGQCQLA